MTAHPLAAMLLDELGWMRAQFADLPPSPGTDVMRTFLEEMDEEAVALDSQLAAGPIPVAYLTAMRQRVALRVDATRQALQPIDDGLHFLLLAGGSAILTWCSGISKGCEPV